MEHKINKLESKLHKKANVKYIDDKLDEKANISLINEFKDYINKFISQ
jgi:hypothetical protein